MIEEWRPVKGYEGLYEVSSLGRVRSLDRYVKNGCSYRLHKGKVISLLKGEYGYIQVNLYYNGKNYKKYVHRLVAEAFLPNPDNLPQVNHKDEVKSNNRVENLECCSAKYNINFGTRKDKVRNTAIKNGYWSGLSKEEYWNRYRNEHREHLNEYQKKYYLSKKKDYMKKYYLEHKKKICEQQRSYYQENKEKICEQKKEYRRKKKEQIQNNV